MLDKVNDDNFFDKVVKSDKSVVVDFFSTSCGPCMQLVPIIEKVAKEYKDKVKFAGLRVENNQKIPQNFGIMAIPTLLFFKDGKVIEQITGLTTAEKIKEIIDEKLI